MCAANRVSQNDSASVGWRALLAGDAVDRNVLLVRRHIDPQYISSLQTEAVVKGERDGARWDIRCQVMCGDPDGGSCQQVRRVARFGGVSLPDRYGWHR